MEPFPPELIAQIATKLFQQGRTENSNVSQAAMASHSPSAPTYGSLPEIPPAFTQVRKPVTGESFGHNPANQLPVGASHLPAMNGGSSMPSMPMAPSGPSMPSAPNVPSAPGMHGFSSMPSVSSVPGATPSASSFQGSQAMASSSAMSESHSRAPLAFRHLNAEQPSVPSTGSGTDQDGLSRFVAQVRNQTPAKRDNCLDQDQMRFRQAAGRAQPGSSSVGSSHTSAPLDIGRIRDDFPILRQQVHGHPLAWLDNAATTQKPQVVIDSISRFYETDNSNIHRAAHSLAARATDAYEASRDTVARFLGASSSKDIVFARGTTEAINLVANTYGARYLKKGDEILLSMVEHHANIVPWQMIAKRKGAVIRVIPINDRGEIIMDEYLRLLNPRTRTVSLTHASNSLGTILPVVEMTHMAKRYGARVLIDGAQSVSHMPINVHAIGCDFFVFSGHKIFGPTGIGALYVTEELHDVLPPWQGGGNMIKNVTFEKTTYSDAPAKFEAGTPNIADAVGLKAALDYVASVGLSNIAAHEHELLTNATEQLSRVPGLRMIGNAHHKVSVISFVMEGRSTEEIGKALDHAGIAVRSGHHCAQPSLRRFGVETTVRPSFSVYNTHAEVDRLASVVHSLAKR